MRGKVIHPLVLDVKIGITPAYAGKRRKGMVHDGYGRDHPRVCGEKFAGLYAYQMDEGSPPRMRGKESRTGGIPAAGGITPAYAGKSRRGSLCGQADAGSPPRMRGKVKLWIPYGQHFGITPAYAGKRCTRRSMTVCFWDHPRVCGEKGCCRFSSLNHSGSPPRMRGKGQGIKR